MPGRAHSALTPCYFCHIVITRVGVVDQIAAMPPCIFINRIVSVYCNAPTTHQPPLTPPHSSTTESFPLLAKHKEAGEVQLRWSRYKGVYVKCQVRSVKWKGEVLKAIWSLFSRGFASFQHSLCWIVALDNCNANSNPVNFSNVCVLHFNCCIWLMNIHKYNSNKQTPSSTNTKCQ